ncbi:2-amino-4-hydroxy-6-hydroxymethyldihydropteridine diphosphokinase [Silvanigrella aquatica]|uniref:2-amino-4-hydroxy-6-hydroxymethyldihydropteridine pyrophosphokinase n=1 Tax=Silvanigrella aquatica TaxID=1915309 RepID=A0A1L4CY47_9BACT|nr:2-amino-4-hydroxy-6-hydroxymethyldihydropteridine diphosphokinase [Silvanigrella aquatica]APJ02860.1 2-amino-4-hydroxy-6-hydroxymethyldihydropteridine diphosphokinase [Silvanigrella aquatica]
MLTNQKLYKYLLAFGSNVGNRHQNLNKSLILLEEYICITKQSVWSETTPLKHPEFNTNDHENYVNFVCEAESRLNPAELYENIKKIENIIGHPRERRWMPRSLDVDILFCVQGDTNTPFLKGKPFPFKGAPDLNVPHKEYYNRLFWRHMVEKELNIPEEFLAKHFEHD